MKEMSEFEPQDKKKKRLITHLLNINSLLSHEMEQSSKDKY